MTRIAALLITLALATPSLASPRVGSGPTEAAESTTSEASPASTATSKDLRIASLEVKGSKVQTTVKNGKILLTGFDGEVGGGRVKATGQVWPGDSSALQRLQVRFDGINVRELATRSLAPKAAELAAGLPASRAQGIIDAQWRGTDGPSIASSGLGAAVVRMGSGVIPADSFLLKRITSAAGLDPAVVGDGLEVTSGTVEATLRDGEVVVRSATLAGRKFRFDVTGSIGLREGSSLALIGTLAVSPDMAEGSTYGRIARMANPFQAATTPPTDAGAAGFIELPRFSISGTIAEPRIGLAPARTPRSSSTAIAGQPGSSMNTRATWASFSPLALLAAPDARSRSLSTN